MRVRLFVSFSLFYLMCAVLLAQETQQNELFTQYKFHRINKEQGLFGNEVIDIDQDTLGQIWVATENGVYRYQGESFQGFFRKSNDENSLPSNYVSDLFIDGENQVWMLTESGVCKYDYTLDEITRFMSDEISGPVISMAVAEDGRKFFGQYFGGILTEKDGVLKPLEIRSGRKSLVNGIIIKMNIVDNYLWAVAGGNDVIAIDLKTNHVESTALAKVFGMSDFQIFDLYVDQQRKVWAATNNGLFRIKRLENGRFDIQEILEGKLPKDDLLTVFNDNDNQIWIGTRQHGMYSFKNTNTSYDTELNHFGTSSTQRGLSYRTISKIFQDSDGMFWLGTHNDGLNVFNPKGESVRLVTSENGEKKALNFRNVWGISKSSEDRIWVGTDGKGLNILNPFTEEVRQPDWPELENVAVLSVLEDSQQRLWVGTYKSGLYMIDLPTNTIKRFYSGGPESDLRVNDIRTIFQCNQHVIYVGTNQGGAYYYNENRGTIDHIERTNGYDIRTFEMTEDQLIWMGTYRNGLLSYDRNESILKQYPINNASEGLVTILDMYNQDNKLWLGTRENGLMRFDCQGKAFQKKTFGELSNISISSLHGDPYGNVWMTASSGVYVYEVEADIFLRFGKESGFQEGHFNYGSILLMDKGYLATGGVKGLNLFYPEDLISSKRSSDVVFHEFKVADSKMTLLNSDIYPDEKSIFLSQRVDLNHTDNVFTIGFSIPGFNKRKQDEFLFILEDYDDLWQKSEGRQEVTYRNVPPGDYRFKVKNLIDENASRELQIRINPPLWRTWQAYLLFLVVIALVLWWLIKFNSSRLLLKQNLEFEQSLREKEHNVMQEKLRFYTNFSHELKTPLTLIQGPVNDLIKKETDPSTLQYLNLIKKNTSVLLKFIRRMLEFRKIEMNKTLLNVGLQDLYILAQEEAENFAHLSKEKGIRLGFYCEQDLYAWVDIEKIQIVLSNLLSNAIKFSSSGTVVKFGMFHEDDHIVIEVKDNGVGIDKKDLRDIFSPFYQASNSAGSGGTGIGLALCRSFIELHGGTITVESEKDKGTSFTIRLNKGKEHLQDLQHVRFVKSKEGEFTESIDDSIVIGKVDAEPFSDSDKVLLFVDDNDDISTYVNSLFARDFKVITCNNAEEGLEKAIEFIPDIIISDYMMPGKNGADFCKDIKANMATSHIPFILLTARSSSESKMEGFAVGADDFITKPFSSELLEARVNNILSNRNLLQLKYESRDLIEASNKTSSREAEFVLKVESTINLLMENSEFNVPDLCRELGMSQTSLYRKVKTLTGDSIQLFIRKIKIKRAAELLISEDLTVTETCFALDFSDLKYFRKCFKEQFGMTPSEYKNKALV
ncbi:MAG: ATP-binding protein [Bacteroidota bacterium]